MLECDNGGVKRHLVSKAALLGCSLSVAALASVRGHHGQVNYDVTSMMKILINYEDYPT